MKKLLLAAVALLVAAPATAAGPSSGANARALEKSCTNLKAQMGARNFNAALAPRTHNARAALRNCVQREAAAREQARANAARTCKAWRSDADAFAEAMQGTANEGKSFTDVFGAGANGYGKCVSTVARQRNQARRAALVHAAKTCRAWKSDADAFADATQGTANESKTFAEVYGSGASAYGRCVSQQARSK